MQYWQDFFKIVNHPDPGVYYIHWKSSSKPVMGHFYHEGNAIAWIQINWQSLIDEEFEKEVLGEIQR